MELQKVILSCCFMSILIADVIVASPLRRSRDLAEIERLEYAVEEGLAVYREEKRMRRRRHRRRTNRFIEAMRMCINYRHYPRERMPGHCRDHFYRTEGRRRNDNNPTIVIIEK